MHDSYLASKKTVIKENGIDTEQTNANFTEMANATNILIMKVDNACITMLSGNPMAYKEEKKQVVLFIRK